MGCILGGCCGGGEDLLQHTKEHFWQLSSAPTLTPRLLLTSYIYSQPNFPNWWTLGRFWRHHTPQQKRKISCQEILFGDFNLLHD